VDAPADEDWVVDEGTVDMNGMLSASTSFNASIRSDDDDDFGADSDTMELYSPSSPWVKQEPFLLPDIMEEADELDTEEAGGTEQPTTASKGTGAGEKLNQTTNTLEETETSFSEEVLGILERTGSLRMSSQYKSNPSPVLPVSPPPGPLLLSDLKKPIPPALPGVPTVTSEKKYKPPPFHPEITFRHSVVGGLDDIPPPLPKTQPPGKLMSPRHSLFMDLADIGNMASSYHATELDLSQLVPQMTRIREAPADMQTNGRDEDTKIKQRNSEADGSPLLVPPPSLEESPKGTTETSGKNKRPESYYYKTFEPPKEFSDSGYQDTDNATDGRKTQTPPPTTTAVDLPQIPSAVQIKYMQATQNWIQQIDSSTTFTSDDQMTENSGSMGLKPEESPNREVRWMCPSKLLFYHYVDVLFVSEQEQTRL